MHNLIKSITFERLFSWVVFLLFARVCMGNSCYSSDYFGYGISDFLINYEGGFVRRGILGEFLWLIEQIHLFDVRIAIMVLCIVSSISILSILLMVFKKEGWPLLLIPTGFCIGFTFLNLGGRRDFLSLLMTFCIFICFKKIITYTVRRYIWWGIFYILSVFQILMHEASFFYTFPILMLLHLKVNRISHDNVGKSLITCLLFFLPIVLTMLIVCIFKGDHNCADAIWASWQEVFTAYPSDMENVKMGAGVSALTWNAAETFRKHLWWSYIGIESPSYWRIIIVLCIFIATYYLVTRINTIDMGVYKKKAMNSFLMSNVLLFQFIPMLPLFTILSCDWGRTIPYWVISSLFFYHIYKKENNYFPMFLSIISHKIQTFISSSNILRSSYTYSLLVLLTPVPNCTAPFDYENTFQQLFINILLNKIHQIVTLAI